MLYEGGMNLLYGKPIADEILNRLKSEISLHEQKPGLAVILVGDDEASKIYVGLKEKTAQEIGMNFFRFDLAANISQEHLIERIEKLNHDKMVNGIIVQLPLPAGFDASKVISAISPDKDADGFLNKSEILLPVFPKAILKMIQSAGQDLNQKKALVVANSHEFGEMMTKMLSQSGLVSKYVLSAELPSNLREIETSDIVVSAVGSKGLLRGEMLKNGCIIIDGGIEKDGEKVVGDVDRASFEGKNVFLTPVPGGVGPVTIACLLENTYLAFKAQQKEK